MILRHYKRSLAQAKRAARAWTEPSMQRSFRTMRDDIRSGEPQRAPGSKVLILGAGMTGLSCAYELSRKGFQVALLEAERTHVGGRVRTHRRQAASGEVYAELGAMRIPASHNLTLGYIEEFGLATRPFIISNPEAFKLVRSHAFKVGELSQSEDSVMDLFDLSPEERALGSVKLWEKAVLGVLASLTEDQQEQLFAEKITDSEVAGLDHKALATAFQDAALSNQAREFALTMIGLETALPIALTEHLREEKTEVWLGDFFEIVGGTDTLARAFVDRLRATGVTLDLGCRVTSLRHDEQRRPVAVYRDRSGTERVATADWIICTIPLGVLNRLDIHSAFSPQRLRAIQGINYDPSCKVIGRSPYRWWEKTDGIFGGGSMFDTQMGSTWYPADNAARDEAVTQSESLFLASYTWGQLARRIATIPRQQLDDVMRQELGRIHTSVRDKPDLYSTEIRWCWDQHPFHAGAYAFFMPGEHYRFYEDLTRPEGRIFLAGEHASLTHSWIQGAFESAVRTMHTILTMESASLPA